MRKLYMLTIAWILTLSVSGQTTATFDDISLASKSYLNGSDGLGGYSSGSYIFPNSYNADWGSWSGFSISNMTDSVTRGYNNQYSAVVGSGAGGSKNYAVVYVQGSQQVTFKDPQMVSGCFVTNSTYAYYAVKDGDDFSKKFGGTDGTDPDYFKLVVTGKNLFGQDAGKVEFFLADYRFQESDSDYVVDTWEWMDLSKLGVLTSLTFHLESTDQGIWGMNTPAYFCIDDFGGSPYGNLTRVEEADMENSGLSEGKYYQGADGAGKFISGGFTFLNDYNPEWSSWSGFAISTVTDNKTPGYGNQFSAIPGKGAKGTATYAVGYVTGNTEITFPETVISGLYVTNSTYAYWSMKNGDDFSKKFGGIDGKDPDWFKLIITGISATGDTTGVVEKYLADFRSTEPEKDNIVDQWEWTDLTTLGKISSLRFTLASSDQGVWGMNTPAYFCVDKINYQDQPPVVRHPVATVERISNPEYIFYVDLDSIFTDPDDPDENIAIQLEYIDPPGLLTGSVVKSGKPGEKETVKLTLNVAMDKTGSSRVILSATSNGKTVYHAFEVIIHVPVSAEIMELSDKYRIFPNPFRSGFYLAPEGEVYHLEILDQAGRTLYEQKQAFEGEWYISALENQPRGLYLVRITQKDGVHTKKMIKN